MRRCSKCDLKFADSAKLCRSCGAILEDVASESDPADAALGTTAAPEGGWYCPQCRESVPDTFEICWNCGSEQPAKTDSQIAPESRDLGAAAELNMQSDFSDAAIRPTHCAACGSARIIPNATIMDQGQYSNGRLSVEILGDPNALLFKDRLHGALTADICGDCGHVQIYVSNPGQLYEHFQRAQQQNQSL